MPCKQFAFSECVIAAINENNRLYVWGDDTTSIVNNIPSELQSDGKVKYVDISAKRSGHIGVITTDDEIRLWGDNTYGQCDIPSGLVNSGIKQLSVGHEHTACIDQNNKVWIWGNNSDDRCTLPTDSDLNENNVVYISAGQSATAIACEKTTTTDYYHYGFIFGRPVNSEGYRMIKFPRVTWIELGWDMWGYEDYGVDPSLPDKFVFDGDGDAPMVPPHQCVKLNETTKMDIDFETVLIPAFSFFKYCSILFEQYNDDYLYLLSPWRPSNSWNNMPDHLKYVKNIKKDELNTLDSSNLHRLHIHISEYIGVAIDNNEQLWVWGDNTYGQCDIPGNLSKKNPNYKSIKIRRK
jgi:TusA-related sulfurtransferase